MWYEKYLGIPFAHNRTDMNACDCGGLVLMVLKNEVGFDPGRACNDVKFTPKEKDAAIREYLKYGNEVTGNPYRPFDVFFQDMGHILHCGVVVDDKHVLHALQGLAVKLEPMTKAFNPATRIFRLMDEYDTRKN